MGCPVELLAQWSTKLKSCRNVLPHVCPISCRIASTMFPGRRSYKVTKPGFSCWYLFTVVVVFLCSRERVVVQKDYQACSLNRS